MSDGGLDAGDQVSRQTVRRHVQQFEQIAAAEIGPVPIGRGHLVQRLLDVPGPDAVGCSDGIGLLPRQQRAHDAHYARVPARVAGASQPHGVVEAVAGGVDRRAWLNAGVVADGTGRIAEQSRLFVETRVHLGERRIGGSGQGLVSFGHG